MDQLKITDKILEDYECFLEEEEKSTCTIEKYMRDVKRFAESLGSSKVCSRKALSDYKKRLLNDYKTASVNSILGGMNSFLCFVGFEQWKLKKCKIQRTIFCSEEKELTKREYERLLQVCRNRKEERLELIIQTICATGIRISELKFFTVQQVRRGKVEVQAKNKERIILIPDLLRRKLLNYTKKRKMKSGIIFLTKRGNPIDRSNIWKQMKGLCAEANVNPQKVFPHNLRHLFARTFYNIKKDIAKLADILGHSSIETTRIYTVSAGKEHKKQLEKLGLVV